MLFVRPFDFVDVSIVNFIHWGYCLKCTVKESRKKEMKRVKEKRPKAFVQGAVSSFNPVISNTK